MVFCCFGCVSKKVSGCWFLALLEAAAEIKFGDQNFDKIGFLVGFQRDVSASGEPVIATDFASFSARN